MEKLYYIILIIILNMPYYDFLSSAALAFNIIQRLSSHELLQIQMYPLGMVLTLQH